jgi:hypothetical protein
MRKIRTSEIAVGSYKKQKGRKVVRREKTKNR